MCTKRIQPFCFGSGEPLACAGSGCFGEDSDEIICYVAVNRCEVRIYKRLDATPLGRNHLARLARAELCSEWRGLRNCEQTNKNCSMEESLHIGFPPVRLAVAFVTASPHLTAKS